MDDLKVPLRLTPGKRYVWSLSPKEDEEVGNAYKTETNKPFRA